MAEEQDILAQLETAVSQGGEGGGPAKKSPIVKILVIVVLLLALGGGGYFAYNKFFKGKASQEAAQPEEGKKEKGKKEGEAKSKEGGEHAEGKKAEKEIEAIGSMVTIEPFIVNLAGEGGKRILKVTVTLELSSPEVQVEFQENHQKIMDSVLLLLSSKTFDDVYSIQGKFKLKDEITTRANRFLVLGHVKDAYFTEFIIQ
jgi:flagellar FliL protein